MNIKTTQIITIIFLILSVVLIVQISSIYPDIAIMKDKIKVQESAVNDSIKILERAQGFAGFAANNKEVVSKFDLIMPSNEDKANLLSSLDSMARFNNLNAAKISFVENNNSNVQPASEGTNANDFDLQAINLTLRGSYDSFKNFLAAIEKNVRVMDVTSVDFSISGVAEGAENSGVKIYSYEVQLKTYLLKTPKASSLSKLLSSEKFNGFAVENLNFTNEKVFKELQTSSGYNVDTGADEIGNRDIF